MSWLYVAGLFRPDVKVEIEHSGSRLGQQLTEFS